MFSALLRFLLGGSNDQPEGIPVSKRRFVHVENIDHTIFMKSESKVVRVPKFDRVTVTKRDSRSVLIKRDNIVKIPRRKNIVKVRD